MGGVVAAVSEFFGATEATAAVAETAASAAGTAAGAAGADAAVASAGALQTAGAGSITSALSAGGSLGSGASMMTKLGATALQAGASAVGAGVVSSLLAPKPQTPRVTPVTPMPDPLAQQAAQKKAMIDQMARRGRASTIMTDSGSAGGSLGG